MEVHPSVGMRIHPSLRYISRHIGLMSVLAKGSRQLTFPPDIHGWTATLERLVNTYEPLSRLCNHLWLHVKLTRTQISNWNSGQICVSNRNKVPFTIFIFQRHTGVWRIYDFPLSMSWQCMDQFSFYFREVPNNRNSNLFPLYFICDMKDEYRRFNWDVLP